MEFLQNATNGVICLSTVHLSVSLSVGSARFQFRLLFSFCTGFFRPINVCLVNWLFVFFLPLWCLLLLWTGLYDAVRWYCYSEGKCGWNATCSWCCRITSIWWHFIDWMYWGVFKNEFILKSLISILGVLPKTIYWI